ncbi:MAG TPA: anthranilate synthase component I family protein [Bacteroidia bacterium]|nr:anthranilate synthase component I family protein [Bacteroidia bacterium]
MTSLSEIVHCSGHFPFACVLAANEAPERKFDICAGFSLSAERAETGFPSFPRTHQFLFGHLSYDLKNHVEKLHSAYTDRIGFPGYGFFAPAYFFRASGDDIVSPGEDFFKAYSAKQNSPREKFPREKIRHRTTKEKYISDVTKLKEHIRRGDIYEINYCIEFFAENVAIDPPSLFLRLNEISRAPFSALYRWKNAWLVCASPERFLEKTGDRILSQPIKGTRPRGKNEKEDAGLAEELLNDPKERSENVMIVDLVRNDLSKIAARGSVKVDELFGIYSFPNVHQMISTVSANVAEGKSTEDILRATFPMGSMTGAPKIRAMQLAEESENMRRGLYSGSVGYFTPEGDFDLNVVIRSIQWNAATGYLSFMTGSAITANCDPEKEYEECLLKAQTLLRALGAD